MATKITTGLIDSGAITSALITDASITADDLHTTLDLTGKTVTVATASAGDNDTSVASTAFVSTAIANLADSAPSTLDTLNELAAALGDDANYATTTTNAIAAKLPLSGGAMTGAITTNSTFDGVDIATRDGVLTSTTTTANAALPKAGGTMTGALIVADDQELQLGNSADIKFKHHNSGYGHLENTGILYIDAEQIQLRTDNSDVGLALTLNSSHEALFAGKVGIGTSTPHGLLQFDSNLNTRKIVLYEGADNDYQFYGFGVEDSTLVYSTYTNTDDHVFFTGASTTSRTELMRIEGTGNVGIGHTSPKSKLSIVGDGSLNTYSGVIGIENTANDKWGSITLTDDIDTASASSNYYLIGRGSTYADRHMSFHIPNAANYGSGSQPKFVFASAGSDELFTVEASTGTAYYKGNVGIGETSPDTSLHIKKNQSSTNSSIKLENAAGGNNSSFSVDWQLASSGTSAQIKAIRTNSPGAGDTDLRFSTSTTGTTLVEAMRIDAAGIVTTPYQPGFKIAWNSKNATGTGRILSTAAGDSQAVGRDQHNTGNHLSLSTGRFTAPVAGTYLLGFQAMRSGTNGASLECRIKKNGGAMWARAYQGAFDQSYQYWSIVTTTKCAAGDYFQVYIGPSTSIYNDDTYFYGHLLG